MDITNVEFESGYIVLTDGHGRKTRYPMTDLLRAADIPDLTIDSLTLLTTLAQVVMVLVKDLVDKGVIGEELVSGFDLQYLRETLVDTLNAEEV